MAWVNAEDAASLAGGLAAVAEAAGLAGQGGGDPGRVVRHWLEAGGDRCLLVFDNAADPDLLRPYLPAAGAARVLVTSNRQSVADLGDPVGVEVFTPAEAVAFLAGRTGLADPAGAGELADELGFLPLALAQAAAVIRGQRLTYGTYLERLRALPVEQYLTRGPGQPYPHGMAEAVLLSLQAVRAGDQAGACGGVLEVLSVLSAAGVRRDLLYAAGQAGMLTDGGRAGSARRWWMRRWGGWRRGRCWPSAWTARPWPRTAWCCGWSGIPWPSRGGWRRCAGPPPRCWTRARVPWRAHRTALRSGMFPSR